MEQKSIEEKNLENEEILEEYQRCFDFNLNLPTIVTFILAITYFIMGLIAER